MTTRKRRMMIVITLATTVLVSATPSIFDAELNDELIAHGVGTTIIEGGTGSPGFVPVLTTVAFHARRTAAGITGAFECLVHAPEASTGSHSAQFTVSAMNVTGVVTAATLNGDEAILHGVATITGLGAGTNVPFIFSVRDGGPGSPAGLTTGGLTFKETLVEGAFRVSQRP